MFKIEDWELFTSLHIMSKYFIADYKRVIFVTKIKTRYYY